MSKKPHGPHPLQPAYTRSARCIDLGKRVQLRRIQVGWTQIELAHAASVSQATISRLEGGSASARLDDALAVIAALGGDVTVTWRERE